MNCWISKEVNLNPIIAKSLLLLTIFSTILLSACASPQSPVSDDVSQRAFTALPEVVEPDQSQVTSQTETKSTTTVVEESGEALAMQAVEPEQSSAYDQSSITDTPVAPPEIAPYTDAQPTAGVLQSQAEALPSEEPQVGFLAPDLTLINMDGNVIRLSDLRGKNVVINYWVTWCVPCQEELPALDKISQEYQNNNLVVISINGIEQDQIEAVRQMVSEMGLTQTIALDENENFWQSYLVQFLPTSFFIDSQGIIRHILLGSTSEENFRTKVDELLAGQL